jgi:hypothetical protein
MMPAVNRLPRKPRPMPPSYQPEVAAQAVVYAAEHPRRREYWVGGSTVLTVLANRVAPGLLDRYLGRYGVQSQYTSEPADDEDGHDYGADGRFDDAVRRRSVQVWASQHRPSLAVAAGAAAVAGAVLIRRR